MKSSVKRVSTIVTISSAAAVAAFFAWLFSLQSSLGLFVWQPEWRRNFLLIGAAGALPLMLTLSRLIAQRASGRRDEGWKPGKVLSTAAIAASGLALLLAGGLLYYIESSARSVQAPVPVVKLLDPKAGIAATDGVLRITLSSDPHWGSEKADAEARTAILRSVAQAKPKRDAFFILGDNVETGMVDEYWHAEALDLSSILGDLPLRPILGNHDGLIDGQYHFERYFFPKTLSSDSGSPLYYSIDAGPATIIVLDLLWGSESFDKAQAAWLEKTLSNLGAGKQAVVLSHCFFYASGYVDKGMPWYDNKGTIDKVSPILERHKVALVVSGHNHYMEYLEKNGVSYAVIGAMGGILDPTPTYVSPASLWLKQGTNGRLDLDIGASGIGLAFRDKDGALLYETRIPAVK
jgi:UDP-2,3-diacylglucosamine pyrophosphatase LpxH